MMKLSLLVGALLLAPPVLAQEAPAATDAAPVKIKSERKICRDAGETGSRLTNKVCHTKTEWAQIEAANQANAQNMTRNGGYGTMNKP